MKRAKVHNITTAFHADSRYFGVGTSDQASGILLHANVKSVNLNYMKHSSSWSPLTRLLPCTCVVGAAFEENSLCLNGCVAVVKVSSRFDVFGVLVSKWIHLAEFAQKCKSCHVFMLSWK